MASPTRWGVLGTGTINHDFTAAILMMPDTEHQVCAVASRSLDRAIAFNEQLGNTIPKTYGSYEEIAKDPEIDVIYVGAITPTHHPIAMMMMEAGKSVLIEKPMAMNSRLVKELVDKSQEKDVFLLEGFWSRFFPVYHQLRNEIASGGIGDIHTVMVNFGADLLSLPKARKTIGKEFGDGALLPVGCYAVQLATMVFNNERPQKITATAEFDEKDCDTDGTAVLQYGKGRRAVLNYAMDKFYDQTATIMGTNGMIKIPMFIYPTEMITPTKTYQCPLHKNELEMKWPHSEGFTYEIAAVRNCLLKGEKQHPLMSHEHSLVIHDTMDKIRSQIGLVYEEDKI